MLVKFVTAISPDLYVPHGLRIENHLQQTSLAVTLVLGVDTSCMGTYNVPKYIFHTYILLLLEKLGLLEVLFSFS